MYKCECNKEFEKSQSLNAHYARCIIHREGNPIKKRNNGGGWNKGLDKHSDIGVLNQSASLSKSYKSGKIKGGFLGKNHSDEFKSKMSNLITERNSKNESHCKWYDVFNGEKMIKVQGQWERRIAERLTSIGYYWERKTLIYNGYLRYTPDFFLPAYNIYIEVKGWWKTRDIQKMKKAIEENKVEIRIIDSKSDMKRIS